MGGGGWAGRKGERCWVGVIKEGSVLFFFSIFGFGVCLLAANQDRGASFLLQAKHHDCPSLLLFYDSNNNIQHHAAGAQGFRLSAMLAHGRNEGEEKQTSMHTLARCPSVSGRGLALNFSGEERHERSGTTFSMRTKLSIQHRPLSTWDQAGLGDGGKLSLQRCGQGWTMCLFLVLAVAHLPRYGLCHPSIHVPSLRTCSGSLSSLDSYKSFHS